MQKRHVLWCLPVFQMTCNTLVTQNINIAIVSMVSNHNPDESITKDIVCPNTTFFLKNLYKNVPQMTSNNIKTGYDWSEAEQNMVLSGYYWLNYFSIFPGGILAHKFGSKRIVGPVQSISSIMSSLIPFLADYGTTTVSWIRAIQGFLSFMSVPAGMYTNIGNWSPPQERGWFGATFIIGTTIGLSGGSFCFGYIGQYIHWKYIFHL